MWCKDSERREQSKVACKICLAEPHPVFVEQRYKKGESRGKWKTKFSTFDYAEPNPILWKDSERRAENKISKLCFKYFLSWADSCLRVTKIRKGESRGKWKTKFSTFDYAEPNPILWKDSERKRLKQTEITVFICLGSSLSLSLNTRLRLPAKGTAAQRVTISYTLLIYLKTYTQPSRHEATFDLS